MINFSLILFFIVSLSNSFTERNLYVSKSLNDENYNRGQVIFKRDCAACHSIEMDLISTAPALGGITKRRKKEWLYSYTRNSYKMFMEGDSIAKDLRSQNWGLMSGFPKLSNKDLDAIYYFVEKKYEAKKIKN